MAMSLARCGKELLCYWILPGGWRGEGAYALDRK